MTIESGTESPQSSCEATHSFSHPRAEMRSVEAIQSRMVSALSQALEVAPEEVDISLPLENYGLDSLTIFNLTGDLAEWLNRDIPATLFWDYTTIAAVSEHLANENEFASKTERSSRSPLVPIQADGSEPLLFMVHDGDGHILNFRNLVPYLGKHQPFYGLEARGFDDKGEPLTSFEAIAALYVREIRTVQSEGPYYLSGFCLGGGIALDMARQLVEQGQEVALLVFIDTPRLDNLSSMERATRRVQWLAHLTRRTAGFLRKVWSSPFGDQIRPIREALVKNRFLPAHHLREVNIRAFRKYVPTAYEGRINTIISGQPVIFSRDDRLAWDDIATQGLEVYRMPGRQADMLREPNVAILAQHVKTCLDKARQTARSSKHSDADQRGSI